LLISDNSKLVRRLEVIWLASEYGFVGFPGFVQFALLLQLHCSLNAVRHGRPVHIEMCFEKYLNIPALKERGATQHAFPGRNPGTAIRESIVFIC